MPVHRLAPVVEVLLALTEALGDGFQHRPYHSIPRDAQYGIAEVLYRVADVFEYSGNVVQYIGQYSGQVLTECTERSVGFLYAFRHIINRSACMFWKQRLRLYMNNVICRPAHPIRHVFCGIADIDEVCLYDFALSCNAAGKFIVCIRRVPNAVCHILEHRHCAVHRWHAAAKRLRRRRHILRVVRKARLYGRAAAQRRPELLIRRRGVPDAVRHIGEHRHRAVSRHVAKARFGFNAAQRRALAHPVVCMQRSAGLSGQRVMDRAKLVHVRLTDAVQRLAGVPDAVCKAV